VRHCAKFHPNQTEGCVDIAIFRCSRWRPSVILDFTRPVGGHPDVDCLGEGDGGHVAKVYGALRGDGKHCEDSERDASRDGLEVDPERDPRQQGDPEGDPRQQDDEDAWQERRQHVCTQTTLQVDVRSQTWERSFHAAQLIRYLLIYKFKGRCLRNSLPDRTQDFHFCPLVC